MDNATLRARIDEVHSLVTSLSQGQGEMLNLLQKQEAAVCHQAIALDDINKKMSSQSQICGAVLECSQISLAALMELKNSLQDVFRNVVRLQFLASDSMFFQGLDPTRGLPVYFEDALGLVSEIPLDWINTWEVTYSLSHRKSLIMICLDGLQIFAIVELNIGQVEFGCPGVSLLKTTKYLLSILPGGYEPGLHLLCQSYPAVEIFLSKLSSLNASFSMTTVQNNTTWDAFAALPVRLTKIN